MAMKCSNCEKPCEVTSILVNHSGYGYVAALCEECQKNVLTLKIVLSRTSPEGAFAFDGFLPAAVQR